MTTTIETPIGAAETMVLNMGPQHPSTHGVLRVLLELNGEIVVKAEPIIGYLHTGIEKSCEAKTYSQVITLTDRIDYLAPLSNNLGYCLAVEKILGIEVPKRAQYIRVLLTELTRCASHLVWVGTHAIDLGAMTVFLYSFREREEILKIFEYLSGQRMMTSYFRIGGLALEPPPGWLDKVQRVVDSLPGHIDEYEDLLTKNKIWLGRTQGVGIISAADAIAMDPVVLPEAITLIDRHYNSLHPYRPNRPSILAIRTGGRLSLRYADFLANRLVLRPLSLTYPVELIDMAPGESPGELIAGRVALILNEP